MVSDQRLHGFVASERSQTECCMAALGAIGRPASPMEVAEVLVATGLHGAKGWNVARALKAGAPKVAKVDKLWRLTPSGTEWLVEVGLTDANGSNGRAKSALRELLPDIADCETRDFILEAIVCLENDLRRSAIIMSWLAALHVLKVYVFNNYRKEFDLEVRRIDPNWKSVRTLDDYGRLKESDFLIRLAALSVIGKNVKAELVDCLNRRNACGHPNSYQLGDATVAHHIEILILNVFSKFA